MGQYLNPEQEKEITRELTPVFDPESK